MNIIAFGGFQPIEPASDHVSHAMIHHGEPAFKGLPETDALTCLACFSRCAGLDERIEIAEPYKNDHDDDNGGGSDKPSEFDVLLA